MTDRISRLLDNLTPQEQSEPSAKLQGYRTGCAAAVNGEPDHGFFHHKDTKTPRNTKGSSGIFLVSVSPVLIG